MRIIGLDPAFRAGGFGCCEFILSQEKGIEAINFIKLPNFISFLQLVRDCDGHGVHWGIENSNLQNVTFGYNSSGKGLNKISRNVGANQAVSQITVDILCYHFSENYVHEFSPKDKGGKWNQHQTKSVLFDLKYELKAKTSQDERDALKIALLTLKKLRITGF